VTNPNLKITIISDSRSDEAPCEPGETLLSALQRAGWHVPAPCGGAGRCGKCRVSVSPGSHGASSLRLSEMIVIFRFGFVTSGRPVVILEQVALEEPSLDDQRSILRRIRDATDLPTLAVDSSLLKAAGEALAEGRIPAG